MRRGTASLALATLAFAATVWAAPFDAARFLEKRNAFVTLNSPRCIRVPEEKRLADDDEILGVVRNGEPCAYPLRMMAAHRVVNDHLGGPEILITFCPESSAGGAFDPRLDGKALGFDAAGHYQGTTVIADRQSHSLWSVVTGEALTGPMQGKRLSRVPVLITAWARWKGLHSDSWVLAFDTPQRSQYSARYVSGSPDLPGDVQRTQSRADRRLPANDLVLGAAHGAAARAYPLAALRRSSGVRSDNLGGERIVLFHDPVSGGAAAYVARAGDRALSFTARQQDGRTVFTDRETGSTWTLEGHAAEGALKGQSLRPLDFVQTEWYAWAAAHPDTAVAGRR